jgi:uroporphyrinogen decarboxylase
MRQAGRYMAAFREYSEKIPFRQRSETPAIATELSLQCAREYGMDGVVFFSDILTPLTAVGIDWDVVKGKGPVVTTELRCMADVDRLTELGDVDEKLPFIRETLEALRRETEGSCTLVGFVGAPWTLAAYAVEAGGTKDARNVKKMMYQTPEVAHKLVDKLAVMAGEYAAHQVECGAQVVQVFESWAHHLSPADFEAFAKPAAQRTIAAIKARCPGTPVVYYANGGGAYLENQRDMGADMICVDWSVPPASESESEARGGEATAAAPPAGPARRRTRCCLEPPFLHHRSCCKRPPR